MGRKFNTTEANVAKAILPGETALDRIREYRELALTSGEHYVKTPQGVLYSDAGVLKVNELVADEDWLACPTTQRGSESQKDEADLLLTVHALTQEQESASGQEYRKMARVVRVFERNHRIFEAQIDDGITISVCVRDAKNFLPGMIMEVIGKPGRWDYVGRLPRARGRW